MIWFYAKNPNPPVAELWFMLSIFVGFAYVAGFLDSRLFAKLDKKNANLPHELESKYE